MGVTISIYEDGSCSNVAAGRQAGRFPFIIIDSALIIDNFGSDTCLTTQYSLEQAFEGTSLRTNLFPDFRIVGGVLAMYPSRDLTCRTQPRFPTIDTIFSSDGLDQVICQDVTNGFVLYCVNNDDNASLGPRPCRNIQSLVQGTLNPFPLSREEQLTEELENLEDLATQVVNDRIP